MQELIKKNEIYRVKCESINPYGKGVSRIDNLVVFITDLYPEEEADIKITKVEKNYLMGEVVKYIKKVDKRLLGITPTSAYPFKNIDFSYECELKGELVKNNISYRCKKELDKIEVLYALPIKAYRNKVTVFFTKDYDYGSFMEGTHNIIIKEDEDEIDLNIKDVIESLLRSLKYNNISIYDYKTNSGSIKGVSIRRSSLNNKISVMILSKKDEPLLFKVVESLSKNTLITGISVSIDNSNKTNVYSGKEKVLYGIPYITERILDIDFRISNQTFLQVNTNGASLLYKEAIKMADLKENDTALDLYSGAGGISLNLAKYVKKVIGIEIVEDAVKNAEENAKLNGINNVSFYCSDSSHFKDILGPNKPSVLFVDPPRAGLSSGVISDIISYKFNKIIYVSCDPYTLSRDLSLFTMSGYEIKEVKCVNMFPRTRHVESVCSLSLKQ